MAMAVGHSLRSATVHGQGLAIVGALVRTSLDMSHGPRFSVRSARSVVGFTRGNFPAPV